MKIYEKKTLKKLSASKVNIYISGLCLENTISEGTSMSLVKTKCH